MKSLYILLFSFLALYLNAQDSLRTNFTFAADASPFAFDGYSFKMGLIPKHIPKTEVSLEVFSMKIPNMTINLNAENADKGWQENVNNCLALYTDRKLGSNRSSFWGGIGFVHLNHTVSKNNEAYDFQQLEYLTRINYKWFPFKKSNFFINPYIAIAGRQKISGNNGDYALSPFLVITSIYLNWKV